MKRLAVFFLIGTSVWTGAWAADAPAQSGDADKANYSVGYQLGSDIEALRRLGMGPSLAAILKGISDALAGSPPSISAGEMSKTLSALRQARQQRPRKISFDETQTRAFTALNAKREGVVTLPNGLQYKVVKAGTGRQPQAGDTVTINYKASLPNGVVVDSTYQDGEPATLRLDEITVPGLKQALAMMRSGAKWEVYVPAALTFSEYSTLRDRPMIYELELIAVASPAKVESGSSGAAERSPAGNNPGSGKPGASQR